MLIRVAVLVIALALASQLPAGIIFQENFDAQNGGVPQLALTSLTGWTITTSTPGVLNPNVDLIGAGSPVDPYPGRGLYVDMEGSQYDSQAPIGLNAKITTNQIFAPAKYALWFFLGNNSDVWFSGCTTCGQNNTLTVELGDFSQTFNATTAGQSIYLVFTTSVPGALSFENGGPVDATGAILDSIILAEIPEPGTLALTLGALAGLGVLFRRRRGA